MNENYHLFKYFWLVGIQVLVFQLSFAKTWKVGISSNFQKISQVESLLENGDSIVVESGIYINDRQVTISKNNITIICLEGRATLIAGNLISQDQSNGKGIFVIKGNDVTVENIAFEHAKVLDNNGAGIRQEGCNLKVIHCYFIDNEMGILCSTIPDCKTTIEYCTFKGNGSLNNPGYQHNVYINNIDTLIFRFNTSIDAVAEGHELKSRAKFNYIAYNHIGNRISNDSRTVDLPNGGTCILVGNVIEQGPNSANSNILGYGLEGLTNPEPHRLWLSHNTFINKKSNGSFVHLPTTFIEVLNYNNAFIGKATNRVLGNISDFFNTTSTLFEEDINAMYYADAEQYIYELSSQSKGIDIGQTIVETLPNFPLIPVYQFQNNNFILRPIDGKPDIGAFEFINLLSVKDEEEELVIFPNPTTAFIHLSKPIEIGFYKIMELSGKISYIFCDGAILDTSALSNGSYSIQINGKVWRIIKI